MTIVCAGIAATHLNNARIRITKFQSSLQITDRNKQFSFFELDFERRQKVNKSQMFTICCGVTLMLLPRRVDETDVTCCAFDGVDCDELLYAGMLVRCEPPHRKKKDKTDIHFQSTQFHTELVSPNENGKCTQGIPNTRHIPVPLFLCHRRFE